MRFSRTSWASQTSPKATYPQSGRMPIRARSGGFTLVEVSVVLVILAVILGAVASGSGLLRQASGQRLFSEFVTGWRAAYNAYTAQTGVVPGDNIAAPTYVIHGSGGSPELCNETVTNPTLTNILLAQGIEPPTGMGTGAEDRHTYLDGNGSPHELRVCFLTTAWSVSGAASGMFVPAQRHVMRLTGLTIELAMQFDALIDGRLDARFGRFRQADRATSTSPDPQPWPPLPTGTPDANIPEVEAYLLME